MGAKLATNLKAVLDRLGKARREIEGVLLYLCLANEEAIPTKAPDGFGLITIHTDSPDGFVELPVLGKAPV